MTLDNDTLQAAIDAALQTNGDEHPGSLVTFKSSVYWPSESLARLAVAKAFLAALPPASSENWQARAEKAEADSVARPSLSRLRPLAEAGPVPEGCERVHAAKVQGDWIFTNEMTNVDTHFADIILPTSEAEQKVDLYAELKAAKAAGKVIQTKWTNHGWKDNPSPDWTLPPDRYRIKPEPETNEASARGGSLPRLVRPRLKGTRCATCGGKLKLWIAEGVTGVVCCNGCVSLNYVPAAVRRSRERYNDFLRTAAA